MKLFPEIATSVAYRIAANLLWDLYYQTSAEIAKGEYSRLPEMHALACSMKALCTYDSADGIERLRLACGGHGYLVSSNMGPLYIAASPACTYEGENTVLLLQVGRFLMKSWRNAVEGKPLVPTIAYLSETIKQKEFGKWTGSWNDIVRAFQYAASR